VTKRERVIRLNGIGGVTFKTRIEKVDPGFSLKRSNSIVIPSEVEESSYFDQLRTQVGTTNLQSTSYPISIGNQLK
jgi:hypothetical protein